jgi:hypothetical protein
VKKTK